jgi:hypothetical protein
MLRIYQYSNQLIILLLFCFATKLSRAQGGVPGADSLVFSYRVGINGTLDKSLVTRFIFGTQSSFLLQNKWVGVDQIFRYRVGYVQPIGRPKSDLENDLFVLSKVHFWQKRKLFPSVLVGYENSPNIRRLESRFYTGAGLGFQQKNAPGHFFEVLLYGLYEKSDFELLKYDVFRVAALVKGNHYFGKRHLGIDYNIQPYLSFVSATNYRFRGTIRPYVRIAPKLEFSISYDLWYETLVSGTQPKEVSVLLLGFSYSNF